MEYFESHSLTVYIMKMIASLVFLIRPWFPQYLFHVLNETLSLLASFYPSTIVPLKGALSPHSFENSPLLLSYQKFKNLVSSAS